jgi:hypothetical protein
VEGDVRDVPADEASGPAEERLGEWSYRVVRSSEDLLALGEWLQKLGGEVEKTPVGFSVHNTEMALATKAQGWLIPHSSQSPALNGVLVKALTTERASPALVLRDTTSLIQDVEEGWFGPGFDGTPLLSNVIHDMTVLEYVTGRPVARDLSPLKDALDCAVVGPGMALEAPRFYRKVGMPLVRFNAQSFHLGIDDQVETTTKKGTLLKGTRWTLNYDWLLFRVLTHYTRDPTLTRWFTDGSNPLDMWMRAVDLGSEEAIAFLLWMVCGEEEELVSKYYPDWAAYMPEAPQLIKASRIDKNLPTFRLGLMRLTDQYALRRKTETLYGRQSPWGLRPPELLHFAIMGSVHDLLDVAVASIIKMGSKQHWLVPSKTTGYNHFLRAAIRGYTKEDPMEWQQNLEQLAFLNHPLGAVSLAPRVGVE